jgi:hypoxanthine phosphoribosyltransferase
MKYYDKLDDNTFKNKCKYCNKGENPEILDENGWADFSFMNENYRLSDNPNELTLRTFNGKTVKQLYETKEFEKHKWKIKSIPDTVKKYMSFWMKYAFDDTIKNLRTLKEKVKEGSGQNKTGYEDANNDERYRMDEDDSTSGIVIFDDNFATGATTHEAVRLLLDYFNINPDRILCLTPGYMASKTGKE